MNYRNENDNYNLTYDNMDLKSLTKVEKMKFTKLMNRMIKDLKKSGKLDELNKLLKTKNDYRKEIKQLQQEKAKLSNEINKQKRTLLNIDIKNETTKKTREERIRRRLDEIHKVQQEPDEIERRAMKEDRKIFKSALNGSFREVIYDDDDLSFNYIDGVDKIKDVINGKKIIGIITRELTKAFIHKSEDVNVYGNVVIQTRVYKIQDGEKKL
jgi:hypothetical protein